MTQVAVMLLATHRCSTLAPAPKSMMSVKSLPRAQFSFCNVLSWVFLNSVFSRFGNRRRRGAFKMVEFILCLATVADDVLGLSQPLLVSSLHRGFRIDVKLHVVPFHVRVDSRDDLRQWGPTTRSCT